MTSNDIADITDYDQNTVYRWIKKVGLTNKTIGEKQEKSCRKSPANFTVKEAVEIIHQAPLPRDEIEYICEGLLRGDKKYAFAFKNRG